MSTKCTIAYGEDFHFYHECFDDDNVYLEIEGDDIEYEAMKMLAGPGRVMIKIPNAIMAAVQKSFKHEVSCAQMTDEQVLAEATKFVDERIARVAKIRAEGREPGIISLLGMIPYGSAEDPREQQIASGVESIKARRAKQQAELAEVGKIMKEGTDEDS